MWLTLTDKRVDGVYRTIMKPLLSLRARLEELQSNMMETIRSEFRGCLKEAEEKMGPQGDPASLTSLASGITSQIHNLRDVNPSDSQVKHQKS